jgi:antitoxin HigA-1
MNNEIKVLKGIAPGLVLERELQKRGLPKNKFAQSIGEYPQVLGDIVKGKRRISPRIALKLDRELDKEEGYFLILQAFHDTAEERRRMDEENQQELPRLRTILFWDTDMGNLNWQKHKRAIILRVLERGNTFEKQELIRFYGIESIDEALGAGAVNSYRLHK